MAVSDRADTRDGDQPDGRNGEERRRVFFRTVPVFDVAMTDPLPGTEPVPLEPPRQPIPGDSHAHLFERCAGSPASSAHGRAAPAALARPGRLV